MSARIYCCESKHKKRQHKPCRPFFPLQNDVKTTIIPDFAGLQSNTPASTLTPGVTAPVTSGIPATATPSSINFGVPIAYNIATPSINSRILPVAGTIAGTFTGLRVTASPFGFKVDAGVSIVAGVTTPVAGDFTATLVFVPDNAPTTVVSYGSVIPTVSTVSTTTARYDFLFTNLGASDPSSILTPGQFQIRLVSSTTVTITPSASVTTVSPSNFDLFVRLKDTTSCIVF